MDLYDFIYFDNIYKKPVKKNYKDSFYTLSSNHLKKNRVHLKTNQIESYDYWWTTSGTWGKSYTFLDIFDIQEMEFHPPATKKI